MRWVLILLLILLHLQLCVKMLMLARWSKSSRISGRRSSEKKRVDAGPMVGVGEMRLRLGCVRAGCNGSREVGR